MNVGNGDIRFRVPKDFKRRLNGELSLGDKERFPPLLPVNETAVSTMTLGIRGSGNVRVPGEIDRTAVDATAYFFLEAGFAANKVITAPEVCGHFDEDFPNRVLSGRDRCLSNF